MLGSHLFGSLLALDLLGFIASVLPDLVEQPLEVVSFSLVVLVGADLLGVLLLLDLHSLLDDVVLPACTLFSVNWASVLS